MVAGVEVRPPHQPGQLGRDRVQTGPFRGSVPTVPDERDNKSHLGHGKIVNCSPAEGVVHPPQRIHPGRQIGHEHAIDPVVRERGVDPMKIRGAVGDKPFVDGKRQRRSR